MSGLMALGVVLIACGTAAGQQQYSQTPEYRKMIEEVRKAAPSPAMVATGRLPQTQPGLKVEETEANGLKRISTAGATYVLNGSRGSVTVITHSGATWTLTASGAGCEVNTEAGGTVARAENLWTLQTGCLRAELEVLNDSLARLTLAGEQNGSVHIKVDGGGPYFGLGERFWQAGLTSTNLDIRPQDRYGEPGHDWTYVATPLVYTPSGLGLYADTAFDTTFRSGAADDTFELKTAASPVPVYLFSEDSPKGVLTAYTGITGRSQNPPLWTFGPWITTLGGKGEVLEAARRIRMDAMPASALWIYDQNDETDNLGWPFWFASYYGDPKAFTDTLHGQGFRVLTYVHPYVRDAVLPYPVPSPVYAKGIAEGLLAMGADGKPAGPRFELVPVGNVDFTNPKAVDWWQTMITAAVQTQGFDGWMEDFGEWVRDTDKFAAGTGRTISELYPLLYHKVTIRIAQALNPEVAPFSRSGSPGSQSFSPVLWGADQWPNWSRDYGLPSVVTAGITAGMSGYSTWGPDILSAGDNKELWMRWVEFGALTPVMRDHVWNKPEHSFNLWSDTETTAHFRRWASFHASLLPYFATYAAEAAKTGIPIMRHTVLEFPSDTRSAKAEYQYLLGRELLVAPVVQPGQALRTLYLPPGEWVNFWNGDFLTGGQDVTVVSAGGIPLLVRAGSVLPFLPEENTARLNWNDPHLLDGPLVWHAYLSDTGRSEGHFALPDGTSARLVQREALTTIEGEGAQARDYEVIVRTARAPTAVRLDGRPFATYRGGAASGRTMQWWWNPSSFEVHMLMHAAQFKLELEGLAPTQYTH